MEYKKAKNFENKKRILPRIRFFFRSAAALRPALALALCFCICFASACSRPTRVDLFTLCRMLKKEAPQYAFSPEAPLFKDGVFYFYYSLQAENDLLLTLKENETAEIVRATLTAERNGEIAARDLPALAATLAKALIPDCDPILLAEESGLAALPEGKSPLAGEALCGTWQATLFRDDRTVCFILQQLDAETAARKAEKKKSSEEP